MDALVDTLQETALPPELRNMRRENKQRSKLLAQRDQFEKAQRANRKKTRNPDQSHQNQDSQELKQRTVKSDQYSIIPTPTPTPRAHRNKQTKEITNKPTLNLAVRSSRPKENGCEIPFPSSPSSDPHRLSPSSFRLARSSSLQSVTCEDNDLTPTAISHFSKDQHPLSSSTSSTTLASQASTSPTTIVPSMSDKVRIPTISEIVARYTANPPIPPSAITHRSAIPLNGTRASGAIRSIDEIVREYSPMIDQPSSENGQLGMSQKSVHHSNIPLRTSQPPSHDRGESYESSDTVSSIDSIAKEALQCVSVQSARDDESNPHSKHSRPFSNPDPLRRSNQSDSSRPFAIPPSTDATPSARQLKKSVRGECPPNLESLSFTAHADEQIANYLQSPRLTTLLRLKKQPNPHMTVSLADVGSSTGHPVIVFLGLGCVRYLVGLYDELAVALGLRLICIDRWGLGKTTEVPDADRGFLEWSTVVEEVADQLNVGQFSILAHSAGAPYALATTLRLDQRVRGSIHLLAPWVSMTAENGLNAGGYKWLKYLPNSMIKTAQAAEWKMQGWRLGKPPTLARTPVGYDIRAPLSSKDAFSSLHNEEQGSNEAELGDNMPDPLRPSIESRLSDWSRLSSDAHWAYSSTTSSSPPIDLQSNWSQTPTNDHPHTKVDISLNRTIFKKKTSTQSLHHRLRGSPTSPTTVSSSPKVKAMKGAAPLLNRNNSASTDQGEPKVRSRTLSSMSDKLGYRNSRGSSKPTKAGPPSARSAPKANWSTSSTTSQNQSVSSYPELGLSLLRASYSESLKGGTSDLMAILERNSKPWGFSYKDVERGVKIWHGDRDERINLSAAKWMESAMGNCSVKVVEGGDHSLMTNVEVMMDVLESIALDWK
ncbi:uncharacterized protein MELLADRAFT_78021 [Melampsora larici-populina 98AG31]|uniref:AB hydrolase-1 domain-containing protein n=1 Tax=Melampsora larici-populina (strain 98AG31 / pathotype 3-4-7) TaxID=747676 RepID=F4RNW7_MELLP|nr:uncharacterized protein MELLADRAFT_78021 [Melampsora larici-populina 98AG31]EGG05842.1 hypothetical protein MELLADRAFT_78021 [Melampsora larici-populina 98AG31]